jgi:hypothetical protein
MQAEPHEDSKGPADDFGSFTDFHALERLSAEFVGRNTGLLVFHYLRSRAYYQVVNPATAFRTTGRERRVIAASSEKRSEAHQ